MIQLILPKPPSINHIYGYTSRRGFAQSYITKEGKDWFKEAEDLVHKQHKKKTPIETEIEVWIRLYTARRQDVDNILKPLLDLLTKSGVIKDDSLIYKIDVEKFKSKVIDERVEVEIMGY